MLARICDNCLFFIPSYGQYGAGRCVKSGKTVGFVDSNVEHDCYSDPEWARSDDDDDKDR